MAALAEIFVKARTMKMSGITSKPRGRSPSRIGISVLIAALLAGLIAANPGEAGPASAPTAASVTNRAMNWFTEMQAGRTNLSQYAPGYRAQITDSAMKAMSHSLNQYGASPLRAEIVQSRKIGNQAFYVVKFVFARGDATSLLFGFDAAGKITGIGIGSLAGD